MSELEELDDAIHDLAFLRGAVSGLGHTAKHQDSIDEVISRVQVTLHKRRKAVERETMGGVFDGL